MCKLLGQGLMYGKHCMNVRGFVFVYTARGVLVP